MNTFDENLKFYSSKVSEVFSKPNLKFSGKSKNNELVTPFMPDRYRVSGYIKHYIKLEIIPYNNTEMHILRAGNPKAAILTDVKFISGDASEPETMSCYWVSSMTDIDIQTCNRIQDINKSDIIDTDWFFKNSYNGSFPIMAMCNNTNTKGIGFTSDNPSGRFYAEVIELPQVELEALIESYKQDSNVSDAFRTFLIPQIIDMGFLDIPDKPGNIINIPLFFRYDFYGLAISFEDVIIDKSDASEILISLFNNKQEIISEIPLTVACIQKSNWFVYTTNATSSISIFPPPVIGKSKIEMSVTLNDNLYTGISFKNLNTTKYKKIRVKIIALNLVAHSMFSM